jgi:hypothetical protein
MTQFGFHPTQNKLVAPVRRLALDRATDVHAGGAEVACALLDQASRMYPTLSLCCRESAG